MRLAEHLPKDLDGALERCARCRAIRLVGLTLAQRTECSAQVRLRHRPVERGALSRVLQERGTVRLDRFEKWFDTALALTQDRQRISQIALSRCPLQWHAVACALQERGAMGLDGFEHALGATRALAERQQR